MLMNFIYPSYKKAVVGPETYLDSAIILHLFFGLIYAVYKIFLGFHNALPHYALSLTRVIVVEATNILYTDTWPETENITGRMLQDIRVITTDLRRSHS